MGSKATQVSPRQIELIEYMLAHPETPETLCAHACGVANSTYFDWKKKGYFQDEINRRIRERFADGQRQAVETMLCLSRNGDFKASKYILDSFGYAPTQKIEANVSTDINVEITGDSPKEEN